MKKTPHVIASILFVLIILESGGLLVRGWYYTNTYAIKKHFDNHGCSLVKDGLIISVNNSPIYASSSLQAPLCKWYIRDLGSVPRWSKLHYYLEQKRIDLLIK